MKKFTAVILALATVLALATGCNEKITDVTESTTTVSEETEASVYDNEAS